MSIIVSAGVLLAAGCAAEAPSAERPVVESRTGVLEAWLLPARNSPTPWYGPPDAEYPGDTPRADVGDLTPDNGPGPAARADDVIQLEGAPPPPERPKVRIHVAGVESFRLDDRNYAAVMVDSDSGDGLGLRTAGLFPLHPVRASTPAATVAGTIGLWITGAPIANWSDGRSFRGRGTWRYVAPGAVSDDSYSCAGPAADELTPHVYPECLALHLSDDSGRHSPVYGYAADGYPVHGPWVDLEVLARSSWRLRDYSADSVLGCGEEGRRTCVLADPVNPLAGTVPALHPGPDASEVPTGAFFEDYWFDIRRDDGSIFALDAFNGHDHDSLGYHYHVTRIQNPDGSFSDVFPFVLGPWFRGKLQPGAVAVPGPTRPDTAGTSQAEFVFEPDEPPPDPIPPPPGPPPLITCIPRLALCD